MSRTSFAGMRWSTRMRSYHSPSYITVTLQHKDITTRTKQRRSPVFRKTRGFHAAVPRCILGPVRSHPQLALTRACASVSLNRSALHALQPEPRFGIVVLLGLAGYARASTAQRHCDLSPSPSNRHGMPFPSRGSADNRAMHQ